ncbi:MAG: hypothetical protein LBG07_02990 [Treponema sp.]|nr:hypothetical protein [Treponema sp.]
MKKLSALGSILFVVVLLGCTSTPLVNTFMDPDVPREGHAALSVHNNIVIAMVDGQMTLKSSGKGNEGIISAKNPIVALTPGEHVLDVQYLKRSSNYTYYNDTITITTEKTDFIKVGGNFLAGHFYRIYPREEGNNIYFEIIDETDASAWDTEKERKVAVKRVETEKEKLASAKYPKKLATVLVIQKAAALGPTPLEGTWAYSKETLDIMNNASKFVSGFTDMEYTFTGQSYTLKMTKSITARELRQQNLLRKILKVSPLPSTTTELYPGQRGTFEVTGNTIKLTMLQSSEDSYSWVTTPGLVNRLSGQAYDYSFGPDGSLLLSYEGQTPFSLVKRE